MTRARPSGPGAGLWLAGAALCSVGATPWDFGALAAQEPEEPRELGICRNMGNAELEVGIEGVVRDDESQVPLPGATVRIRFRAERGLETPEDVAVTTDARGRYQACGLTAFREARVRARYRSENGRERRVRLDRSQFVDLEVDLGDASFVVFSVVESGSARPVEGAELTFSPLPITGVTDSLGRVAFRAMPPAIYDLRVEHIAYTPVEDEISVLSDAGVEFEVRLAPRAIALEPIEVRITGRDPTLVTAGFFDRRQSIDDGYFATQAEMDNFTDLGQVFQYKRELSIRFRRRQLILLNGRPANRLGYNSANLRELPFGTVKGIEAYRCSDAPPQILNQVPSLRLMGDCNLVAIWTR